MSERVWSEADVWAWVRGEGDQPPDDVLAWWAAQYASQWADVSRDGSREVAAATLRDLRALVEAMGNMRSEQTALNMLRMMAADFGNLDDDGEPIIADAEIVSRADETIPLAAGCVGTMYGPRIVLADTDGAVAIPRQDARKVAAYLLAHATDGPAPKCTVRVRIAVGVTPAGYWYAMGYGAQKGNPADGSLVDEVRDGLSYETDEDVTIHWIEAEIPLPTDEAIRVYPLPHQGD